MTPTDFSGQIFILGYGLGGETLPLQAVRSDGALSCVVLDLLTRDFPSNTSKFIVVASDEGDPPSASQGVELLRCELSLKKLEELLKTHAKPGDLVLNFCLEVDTIELLRCCSMLKLLVVTSSYEYFEETTDYSARSESLTRSYLKLFEYLESGSHSPTAVISAGSNPGLISQFIRQGIADFALDIYQREQNPALQSSLLPELCDALQLSIIVSCERDTQQTSSKVFENDFVTSFDARGFLQESTANAELLFGSRESSLPLWSVPADKKLEWIKLLPLRSFELWGKVTIPSGELSGICFRGDELLTLSRSLYPGIQPPFSMVRLVAPPEASLTSLVNLSERTHAPQERCRVMTKELTEGSAEFGALIVSKKYGGWWCGASMDLEQSREFSDQGNATLVQAAAGIYAAALSALTHPDRGVLFPGDEQLNQTLVGATPFLGTLSSEQIPTDEKIPLSLSDLITNQLNWRS